jgi:hypothetical protein
VGVPDIYLITHADLISRTRVRVVFDFVVDLCRHLRAELLGREIAEAAREAATQR